MPNPTFNGLRVLTLESRRAAEIATLVTTFGGRPISAPALREVPLESNVEAAAFADAIVREAYDVVVLLTGVGLRVILTVVERAGDKPAFVAALARTRVVARGPKPVAVLRELGISPWLVAPEPNTSRELLDVLDAAGPDALHRARVAVQEYGRSNTELLEALRARGAIVTAVPVYQYALPDDVEPLREAVTAVASGEVDVTLVTTGTQLLHLLQVAEAMGRADELRDGLRRGVLASIGPTTTETLVEQGLHADLEPSHPKMGLLVREAAEQAATLLARKRT
jgi:uroporphyrinogen-III synthase